MYSLIGLCYVPGIFKYISPKIDLFYLISHSLKSLYLLIIENTLTIMLMGMGTYQIAKIM